MYWKYYLSAKGKLFLLRDLPLMDCSPLLLNDMCGYHVGQYQYHVPTKIEKYVCFFSLGETILFGPSSSMYILIMKYYPDTSYRANLNINACTCLWCFGRVRILINLQNNVGATAIHWIFGDCAVPWTIRRYVNLNRQKRIYETCFVVSFDFVTRRVIFSIERFILIIDNICLNEK